MGSTRGSGPSTFGTKAEPITPNAGADNVPASAKGIIALTGGNLTIIPVDNADAGTITFTAISAGFIPPYLVRRVTAATATLATIDG